MHVQRQLLSSGTDRTDLHRSITETHESRVRWPGGLAEMLDIRHFEVARETGCKCIVGLFWGTHFQEGSKFVPKTVPQYTWQPSRPGLSCNLKVANSHPTRLAAAEADALGTEWSLHWNLSIPVACSKSLTLLPTVQVETGLWGWTINKDSFYFSFHCKRGCQQFQAVYVKKCSEWLHRPTVQTPLQRAPQASLEASLSIMYRRVLVCQWPWRIPHRPLFHDPLHVKERASRWRFGGKTGALLS